MDRDQGNIGRLVEGDTVVTNATYFLQSCPTCGRSLRVRVEYLGKSLACQHCHGRFIATDHTTSGSKGASGRGAGQDRKAPQPSLLERAEALLRAAEADAPIG